MTKGVGGSTAQAELESLAPWPDDAAPVAAAEYAARIEKARTLIAEAGADALVVGAGASLRYFTGVPWGATERFVAMVLGETGGPVFICPAFERGSLEAARAVDGDIRCWEEEEDPFALTAGALRDAKARRVALDPAVAYGMSLRLAAATGGAEMIDAAPVIDGCRMTKSPAEIALMQRAKSMTLEVHRRTARMLRPGITTTEVRDFIDAAHRRIGSDGTTFGIVLFGEASSYPHGVPGVQTLKDGDVVLIDTGCGIGGYTSDITRTYVFGEPNDEHRRIWEIEKAAQAAAFAAAEPGATCESVDAAARAVVERAGLGPDYRLPGVPHRTGHGIGLSIHEAPYLVRGDQTPLREGMCFSNEPMIVVPGRFGVRLEDHFHMAADGPVWFTEPSPSIDAPFG